MSRWALARVHWASMSTASVLPVTMTEATPNPSSSLKKTLVASGCVPLELSLISIGWPSVVKARWLGGATDPAGAGAGRSAPQTASIVDGGLEAML